MCGWFWWRELKGCGIDFGIGQIKTPAECLAWLKCWQLLRQVLTSLLANWWSVFAFACAWVFHSLQNNFPVFPDPSFPSTRSSNRSPWPPPRQSLHAACNLAALICKLSCCTKRRAGKQGKPWAAQGLGNGNCHGLLVGCWWGALASPALAHLYYNSSHRNPHVGSAECERKVCLVMSSNAFSMNFCVNEMEVKSNLKASISSTWKFFKKTFLVWNIPHAIFPLLSSTIKIKVWQKIIKN